jgi:hypothetical protein
MSWSVLDLQQGSVQNFDASGGHFQSQFGQQYLVTLRVVDSTGIESITLEGSGLFDAQAAEDKDGNAPILDLRAPASVPRQSFTRSGTAPTLQDLVVVMKPDIGAFDYYKLSCGRHGVSNLEFFAFDGLMTFTATATNSSGFSEKAELTTSPQPNR